MDKNKKTKYIAILAAISFAAISVVIGLYVAFSDAGIEKLVIETAKNQKVILKVEVAATPEQQQQGLMFRESLCEKCAMLFTMQEQVQKFWMKNTLIPLDIIFIDKNGIIKKIHKNAEPHSLKLISSGIRVNGVLEINGGMADKLGIEKGDKVLHSYFNNMK